MRHLIDRLRTRTAAFVHDLLMVPLAWLGAYWLRENLGTLTPEMFIQAAWHLLAVIPVQALMFQWTGLYRGVWRFASLPDLLRILQSVLIGAAVIMASLFVINRLEGVPRSVPVLYALLLMLLLAGPRLLYRWRKDRRLHLQDGPRVLIVGAGRAGEMLVRDLLRAGSSHLPIGFVDDRVRRHGSEVHGLPVLGGCDRLPEFTRTLGINLILLAIPSANADEMRRLVGLCEASGVPFRTVPKLQNLIDGKVSIDQLREVSIEDLLGRAPITLDWPSIEAGLSGQAVLVTGAAGSIGAELCAQLARAMPARLIVADRGEWGLYELQRQLARHHPELSLTARLLDVTDASAVWQLFNTEAPQVVFHAAAYKHVPLLESQLREAVWNNLIGTRRVADAAQASGVGKFVLISTDKAVRPANAMGASKRMAELYCQGLNGQSQTAFVTLRFGNVLGSSGSVIPLFREQIHQGGPVTLTDEAMERYFMTIPEACELIMQASVYGNGGEVFVLDMGEPVRIRYLAEQMIRLAGLIPDRDIRIEVIGLRPGEKLQEELFYADENLLPTRHPRIRVGGSQQVDGLRLLADMDRIEELCRTCDASALRQLLKTWIPEWSCPDHPISSNTTT